MFDIVAIIKTAGYLGVAGIVFAESGLFIGFFLPGDSLLFTAGFLASQGYLHIALLTILCFATAVAGDSFGYAFGRRFGPNIFSRERSLIWNPEHVRRARDFYCEHGPKTLIIARFIPVIRTFVPIMAGVAHMSYRTFFVYNLIGGLLWGAAIPVLGYLSGTFIPGVERWIVPGVGAMIILSFFPVFIRIVKDPKYRAGFVSAFTSLFKKSGS